MIHSFLPQLLVGEDGGVRGRDHALVGRVLEREAEVPAWKIKGPSKISRTIPKKLNQSALGS